MVRVEGLEPPFLAALDPKSSVSTNSTIPAVFGLNPKNGVQSYLILLNTKVSPQICSINFIPKLS